MSNEIKVGILAIVSIFLIIWGYNFIKGKDIFSSSTIIYIEYFNVDGLTKSAPVTINGFQVGIVGDIKLKEDYSGIIIVRVELDKGIRIPRTSIATITSSGILSGKVIEIIYDNPCAPEDCAVTGDTIRGRVAGMLESLTGGALNEEKTQALFDILDSLFNLDGSAAQQELQTTLGNISLVVANLASATASLDTILSASSGQISSILRSTNTLTSNLAVTSREVQTITGDLKQITSELRTAGLGETVIKARETISSADARMKQLEVTLNKANESMESLRDIMANVTAGKGTLGKLVNDAELYDNINRTSQNLDLLLQDIRLNPKRYTRILSRRQIEYEVPENDPAQID
jgi:phospholipid/cholesterol/gamma-HCH transport system substrate-binding protein